MIPDPRLVARLRRLFLESCINATHFDRALSHEIDRIVAEIEERTWGRPSPTP